MCVRRACVACVVALGVLWATAARAQTSADQDALRQRQRQDEAERQRREAEPAVHSRRPPLDDSDALPEETPCFPIRDVQVDGASHGFRWAQRWARRYQGRCVGGQGVNLIARRLTQRVLARGKVTTRVGIPEQDLTSGVLRLVIVVGRLERVSYADEKGPRPRWKTALPMRPGDTDFQPREHQSWGVNGNYSVPWGYWTLSLSGGLNRYEQKVAGTGGDFHYRGRNLTADVRLERVVHRSQAGKTSLALTLGKRWARTYVNDVEIEVQRRDVTAETLGLSHRHSIGRATLEAEGDVRRGLPWLARSQHGRRASTPSAPST